MLFFAILCFIGIVGISVWRNIHKSKLASMRANGESQGMTAERIDRLLENEVFPIPSWGGKALGWSGAALLGVWMFNFMLFYAEPMYIYHIRTIFNQERVISDIGWTYKGGNKVERWKKAVSVQAASNTGAEKAGQISSVDSAISANLLPQNIVFLDNVDADASATARFRLPGNKIVKHNNG